MILLTKQLCKFKNSCAIYNSHKHLKPLYGHTSMTSGYVKNYFCYHTLPQYIFMALSNLCLGRCKNS